MTLTAKIVDSSIDFLSGKPKATFVFNETNDFKQMVDEMGRLEKVTVEIKPFRVKRSLDANAYCWVLLDRLSEKTGIPKVEIYRSCIKNIGGNSEVICVKEKSAERIKRGWQNNGIGWVVDEMESKLPSCVNLILYAGSSSYDTEQMSRLIDNIVQECQAQGIETATPNEIGNFLSLWGENK